MNLKHRCCITLMSLSLLIACAPASHAQAAATDLLASTPWALWAPAGDAQMTTGPIDGAPGSGDRMHVVISQATRPDYNIQLSRDVAASLIQGAVIKYHFWARSSTSNKVRVVVERTADPWGSVINQDITLTPAWKEYTFTETTPSAYPSRGLAARIQVGQSVGIVDISSATLVGTGAAPPIQAMTGPADLLASGSWALWAPAGDAQMTTGPIDGAPGSGDRMHVVIAQATSPDYNIQLSHDIVASLSEGLVIKYHFWARSSTSNKIRVVVERTADPWGSVINQDITLTPAWKEYTFTETTPSAYPSRGLAARIQVGQSAGTIDISSVTLVASGADTTNRTGPAGPGLLPKAEWNADSNSKGRKIYVSCSFTGVGTGSQDAPFTAIAQASAAASPGDTIIVGDGVYNETVVAKSGTPGNYVTYRAAHLWQARVVGTRNNGCFSLCGTCDGSSFNASMPGPQYVKVDGFELINPVNDGYAYGVKITQAHHITIANCRIHGCGCNGIGTGYSDYIDIEHNVVYDNAVNSVLGPSGISVWKVIPIDQAPGFHNIVNGNVVYYNRETGTNHTDGNGIIVDSTAKDAGTVVENNVVFDNGGAGIALDGSANCTVRFNTLYEDGTDSVTKYAEIRLDTVTWEPGTEYNAPCKNCSVYGNIMYAQPGRNTLRIMDGSVNCIADHNVRFNSGPGDAPDSGDITADPLFVKPSIDPLVADFHLQRTSPAIGVSVAGEKTLRDVDFDGQIRQAPTAFGAYR